MLLITHAKTFWFSVLLLKTTIFGIPLNKNEEPDSNIDLKSMEFLLEKGYLKKVASPLGELQLKNDINGAIKKLQRFANIPITGQLDAQTREYISKPRCGMPDITNNSMRKRKRKYVAQGSRWAKPKLTWAVENDNNDGITRVEVRDVIRRSFAKWAAVTNLEFVELVNRPQNSADIRISFEKGKHGDPYSFDGNGGTLAHAFYPLLNTGIAGDCHFDDDEVFTYADAEEGSKIRLLWVAVHELGHSIGLEHSDRKGAVMYPWYQHFKGDDFNLTFDDINGIQSIYGSRVLPATTISTSIATLGPRGDCPSTVGAIVRINSGKIKRTLVFNNDKFYVLNQYDFGVEEGPFLVSSKFDQLTFVDAIFTREDDNYHFFFHGDTFSVFMDYKLQMPARKISDGFQKLDVGFRDVDAALSIDHKVFLFKGEYYWRFSLLSTNDYALDYGYPKKITTNWKGLPNYVDAAFTWSNNEIYFFKGTEYYRINKKHFKVEYGYPVKLSDSFLKCTLQGGLMQKHFSKGFISQSSYLVLLMSVFLTCLSKKLGFY